MSIRDAHHDWLSLIEISGPFLAIPILKEVFPQGLEELDAAKRKRLRQAYDEWREAQETDDPRFADLHAAWIDEVLSRGLELDEDGRGDVLKRNDWCAAHYFISLPEHGVSLSPDFAVVGNDDKLLMLVHSYGPDVNLDAAQKLAGWASTPAERMVTLCRATGCRLGLVTNGERWMLVDAPVGAVTTFASWYARMWGQEPVTLQAFAHLLGIGRFFVDESKRLPALFDRSQKFQDEVTDALGQQVQRAVEVLIQALDRADQDRSRELLCGVKEAELYEAALTVMMRLVFLLSAEERGLLLLGDERYEANYALSTLRMQLRTESDEILERRWDAWSRLLAVFRVVFGGIEHENLRLPPLGGSLFDPDRFPFLEGRAKGSDWQTDIAKPLPIDNRTVLLLLEAIQQFQGRTLSYRALDVEQIGYVYEGLLERTVKRTDAITLDLGATQKAIRPLVTLPELESARLDGQERLLELLVECSGSSASKVSRALADPIENELAEKLRTTCTGSTIPYDRVLPFANLLVKDAWGYPLVYPTGAFIVTTGSDRRETGTHYTPKSLTQAIVAETLTPIAYAGPADGIPRADWLLRSPAELLELKICDPAMGSGAFLVQACRWLADRLVEAWGQAEVKGHTVDINGRVADVHANVQALPTDTEARTIIARRLIAERCLYGVDLNPLAVELAKLSIWLVTLAKGRPFGFLDHNLRCGDSLLGIHRLDQLTQLSLTPTGQGQLRLFGQNVEQTVSEVIELRARLREMPIHDIRDVQAMAHLDADARSRINVPERIADALVAITLAHCKKVRQLRASLLDLGIRADDYCREETFAKPVTGIDNPWACHQQPAAFFHWPLEFPEVFGRDRGGFDAVIGNPPYVNAVALSGNENAARLKSYYGTVYSAASGSFDIYVLFCERAMQICGDDGRSALVVPNKILSAEYAEPLRRLIVKDSDIEFIQDYSRVPVFSASVYPVVLGLRRSRIGTHARIVTAPSERRRYVSQAAFRNAPSMLWAFLLEDFANLVEAALLNTVPLEHHAEVSGAATVAEAYEIAPAICDLGRSALPPDHAKFVVSGNLRSFSTTWATAPVQYLKTRYVMPVVDLTRIPPKRRAQALCRKIIISGLSKRPVAFLDENAEFLAGKSTVIVMDRTKNEHLTALTAILNSELGALLYTGLFGGLALAGGYLRFGTPQVAAVPVPRDLGALESMLRSGIELEEAVCTAYEVDRLTVRDVFLRKFENVDVGANALEVSDEDQ